MRRRLTLIQALMAGMLVLCLLLPLLLHAGVKQADAKQMVPYTEAEFITDFAPIAQKAAKNYGVKPSVLIAQAALESDYGQSLLASKYHNLYSLTAQAGQARVLLKDKVYQDGKWEISKQRFAAYDNWQQSLEDYLQRLSAGQTWNKELYVQLATQEGYSKAAEALQKYGFSTDPDYAAKLIALIREKELTQYD